jgi:surface polysaccharide O-acyltransferase-like enzyme
MSVRRFEVDLVKAIGIVAVVLIHCLRPFWSHDVTPGELWISSATLFAVPGFLAASGFLYSTQTRVPWADTRARLIRLLVPYLVASVAAQLYTTFVDGKAWTWQAALHDLALASSFGPFYYVLVATVFVVATPFLAMLPSAAFVGVTVAAAVLQWLSWAGFGTAQFFWLTRNPFHWLGFFLAGWWLRRSEALVLPRLAQWRIAYVLLGGATAIAAAAIEARSVSVRWFAGTMALVKVGGVLTLILALGAERKSGSRSVRFLSDSTYTIYLFHLFFVYSVGSLVAPAPKVFDPVAIAAPWLAGIAGPLLLAAAGRALLGRRSRSVLGS